MASHSRSKALFESHVAVCAMRAKESRAGSPAGSRSKRPMSTMEKRAEPSWVTMRGRPGRSSARGVAPATMALAASSGTSASDVPPHHDEHAKEATESVS